MTESKDRSVEQRNISPDEVDSDVQQVTGRNYDPSNGKTAFARETSEPVKVLTELLQTSVT